MNVDSNVQLAELLYRVLGVGNGKVLKRTKGGGQVSTGRRQLEQLKAEHPVVQKCLDYRERAKLKNTYCDALPELARLHPRGGCWCGLTHECETWRVHTQLLLTRTTTGRPASKNPNLQNISVRSKWGAEIRRGFVASPGTVLVSVDFAQIELRILAMVSSAVKLIETFQTDGDPHMTTAMEAFGITDPDKVDKIMHRAPAKNVNFAVVYGESAKGLLEQLTSDTYGKAGLPVPDWLTLEWCEQFIAKWFEIYPEVREYIEKQHYRARRYGLVWDQVGRIRRIPEVRSVHNRVVAAGLRQASNMPIQGFASELLKLAMAEVHTEVVRVVRDAGVWCQPLVPVHDELVLEVDAGWGEPVRGLVVGVFEGVLRDKGTGEEWEGGGGVPVKADGKVMGRWEK